MQCQFCKQMLEDVNALQLHQVASCPAMDQSISFEEGKLLLLLKVHMTSSAIYNHDLIAYDG